MKNHSGKGRNFLLPAVCLAPGPPERAMAPPPQRWNATENRSAPATCPTQSSGCNPTERSFGKSAKAEARCLRFRRPSPRNNAGRLSIMSGRWRHTRETINKKPSSEANNEIGNLNCRSLRSCGGGRHGCGSRSGRQQGSHHPSQRAVSKDAGGASEAHRGNEGDEGIQSQIRGVAEEGRLATSGNRAGFRRLGQTSQRSQTNGQGIFSRLDENAPGWLRFGGIHCPGPRRNQAVQRHVQSDLSLENERSTALRGGARSRARRSRYESGPGNGPDFVPAERLHDGRRRKVSQPDELLRRAPAHGMGQQAARQTAGRLRRLAGGIGGGFSNPRWHSRRAD